MTRYKNLASGRSGFTLIEMMIVIGIIALLAALTLGISNSVLRNSEISRTRDVLTLFDMALQEWELEIGRSVTFRDFSYVLDPIGQGQVGYTFDIDIYGDDEPLLGAPVFGLNPVENEIMLEAMETRMRQLIVVLLQSEAAADILQRISSRHFIEDADGKLGVDAWDTPIGVVFPCQKYVDSEGGYGTEDESGYLTVRDQAEDGLGSCIAKRPYFVSAGPDRMWGYRYQATPHPTPAEDPDWLASLDNVYSYKPYLVEESQ